MKALLIIVFSLIISITLAQPRVETFGGDENDETTSQTILQNVIKLNVFEFAAGDYSFYYERILYNNLTAEIGLGMTYIEYDNPIVFDDQFPSFGGSYDPRMGVSYFVGLRFYPKSAFNGVYISPQFKYRKFYWDSEFFDNESGQNVDFIESSTYIIPRVSFGYTKVYKNNLSFDFHFGIGMASPSENKYDHFSKTLKESNLNTRPQLNLGVKVGYVF